MLLVAVLLTGLFPIPQGNGGGTDAGVLTAQAADQYPYKFIDGQGNGYEVSLSGAEYVLNSTDEVFTLQRKDGPIASGTSIELEAECVSPDSKVIQATIEPSGYSFRVKQKGPGCATIRGAVKEEGGAIYTFAFWVIVPVRIENTKDLWIQDTTNQGYFDYQSDDDKGKKSYYFKYPGMSYQIKLIGIDPATDGSIDYTNTVLDWSVEPADDGSRNVVTVDNNGVLTSLGAGLTKLIVSAEGNNEGKKTTSDMKVIVPVLFSPSQPAISTDPAVKYKDFTSNMTSIQTGMDGKAIMYTTVNNPLEEIEWDIRDEKGTKVDSWFEISCDSMGETNLGASRVTIVGAKAGTYTITGYMKGLDKQQTHFHARAKITIPVDYSDKDIWMNVGDKYDLYSNTNIADPNEFLFTSNDAMNDVVSVNGKGVITATGQGEAIVYAFPKSFENVNNASSAAQVLIANVHVVDTLALSVGKATIPIGGKLDLLVTTTNHSTPITWSVEDSKIATVESDGNVNAVVTGVKSGKTTITASQKINGVEKSVSCIVTVVDGITKITINPSSLELNVGDPGSLQAKVTPSQTTEVELKWVSSDPSVVKVENPNNYTISCSVTGVAPGTAVVMAINTAGGKNVVVGSCLVTVLRAPEKISMSETEVTGQMSDGGYQLFATITPTTATNKNVKWTSSNTKIATVDENGHVTYVKPGKVTIIATSEAKPELMAMCEFTITEPVKSISLDTKSISLLVGENYRLTYVVLPETAYDRSVTFTTMDSSVATVTSNGLITAKKAGTTYITVTTTDGKLSQVCTVTVKQAATSLKLDATALVLDAGETYTLEATFTPKTTTESKLRWASNDTSVAKVDTKGMVTAVGEGTCIISVTSTNNLTVFCYVTVNQPVTGIVMDRAEVKVDKGKFVTLEATIKPDNATNQEVTWKSSNEKVATVSKDGTVKGEGGGSAIITCTTEEGGFFAVSMVTVIEKVTSMTLNKSTYKLGLGKKFTLKAKVKNSAASDQTVTWVSSNPKIVSVNKKGVITGNKLGYATVTAYTNDGSEVEASCEVRVVRQVTGISLNKNLLNMVVGDSSTLKASIRPSNATYQKAKFSSDNTEVALVDANGKVTAVGAGTCKITAAAKDSSGLKTVCVVYVRDPVPATGLALNPNEVTLGIGGTETVNAAIKPTDSTDDITWSSNNKAVATVGKSSGIIKGVAPGTAVVTANTTSGKNATVKVTVVGLNYSSLTLEQYDSYMLRVMGVTTGIIWDVDNPDICTVVGGRVTAKKAGTTTVVARVSGAELRCRITVTEIGR